MVPSGICKSTPTTNGPDAGGKNAGLRFVDDDVYVGMEDHTKVREAMKHFVRDWDEEGWRERCQTFGLVLDALKILEGSVSGRRRKRVSVPGAVSGGVLGRFPTWFVRSSFVCSQITVLAFLSRIRHDGERAFALHGPRSPHECGKTIKTAKCECTSDSEVMMRHLYGATLRIATRPVSLG